MESQLNTKFINEHGVLNSIQSKLNTPFPILIKFLFIHHKGGKEFNK